MARTSEVEKLKQLGGWFLGSSISCLSHRHLELHQSMASFLVNSPPVPRPQGMSPIPSLVAFLDPGYPCFAF